MAKKEILKNELLTVRVNAEPVVNAVEATIDAIENIPHEVTSVAKDGSHVAVDKAEDVAEAVYDAAYSAGQSIRNNWPLVVGVGVVALGVGGFLGYTFGVKRTTLKFEVILEKELEDTRQYYQRANKEGEFESPESAVEALVPIEVVQSVRTYQGTAPDPGEDVEVEVGDELLNLNTGVRSSVINNNVFVSERVIGGFDLEYEKAHRDTDKPYVISVDEFNQNDLQHEQVSITFFAEDDVLVDSKDQMVDNPDYSVGDDNLLRFGHGSRDNKVVYIRNENLDMDFEVLRSEGSYSREVLGFSPPDEPTLRHSGSRRRRGTDE